MDGGARVAARVVAHDLAEPAQLVGGQIAALDLDLDRREPWLALGADVGLEEVPELAAVAVGARVRFLRRGDVGLLVVVEQDLVEREVALADPVALELLLDHLSERVDPDLVDQHLDPGAGAVDPQPVLAVEDPHARLGHLQVVAVVELDELVQRRGQARHDRGAAADPDLDPAHAVADTRQERHVVDPGDRVVLVGRGERGLDLPRQRLRGAVADEVADVRAGVRGDVEQLAVERAGARVAGDVAHRVPAPLSAGEAGVAQLADQLGGVGQRHVVHLDVLAGRDVPLRSGT